MGDDKFAPSTLILIFVIIGLIVVGTFAYNRLEGWNYLDSTYFTVITLTTIGYGDFTPATPTGKIFTMAFSTIGIGIMLYALALLGKYFLKLETRRRG